MVWQGSAGDRRPYADQLHLCRIRHRRLTFSTRAGKLTQNVKALQMLAGHSNIATPMRYVHPEWADIFGIVEAMSANP